MVVTKSGDITYGKLYSYFLSNLQGSASSSFVVYHKPRSGFRITTVICADTAISTYFVEYPFTITELFYCNTKVYH